MQREGLTNWAQKLHNVGMIANAVRFTIDCKTYCLQKETPQLRLQLTEFEQKFNALLKSCLLCLRKIQNLNRNIATVGDYVKFSWDVSKIPYTEQYFYVFSIHWNFNKHYLRLYSMINFACCIFEYCNEQRLFQFQCTKEHS